jgi:hypothetical protein
MNGRYEQMINDTLEELNSIKKWINSGNQFDSKSRYLISYAVIKSSGTVEVVYKSIIFDSLVEGTTPETKTYLEKMIIDSSSNPNTGNMSQMLQQISPEWRTEFDDKVNRSGEKDKLNSLVKLRNDFAHGTNITASIDTVIKYVKSAKKILDILADTVK